MSTAAGTPSNGTNAGVTSPDRQSKGKGKNTVTSPDVSMEDDDDDDDDDDDEEEADDMEEEDEDEEVEGDGIDPSAIIAGGRRTRGVKVDYTSKEALEKAGLKAEEDDDEDEEMK